MAEKFSELQKAQLQLESDRYNKARKQAALLSNTGLQRQQREDFLINCDAVPVTSQLYAAWLVLYMSQGGKVTQSRPSKLPKPMSKQDYSATYMTPQRSFATIPSGYGSSSMRLLLIRNLAGGDLSATSGDKRSGYEYGDTRVQTIELVKRIGGIGLLATTNQPYMVEVFSDVESQVEKIIQKPSCLQTLESMIIQAVDSNQDHADVKYLSTFNATD